MAGPKTVKISRFSSPEIAGSPGGGSADKRHVIRDVGSAVVGPPTVIRRKPGPEAPSLPPPETLKPS